MKTQILALVIALVTTAASAETIRSLRLSDGTLIRVGATKMTLLDKLGFPPIQQGGKFFYNIDGRIAQFRFSNDVITEIRVSQN